MNNETKDLILFIAAVFLLVINTAAFITYFADKRKAIKHRWRIPESVLLGIATAGGSLGAFAAMRLFRHKTKHPKFYITVPIFMIIHAGIIIYVLLKLR